MWIALIPIRNGKCVWMWCFLRRVDMAQCDLSSTNQTPHFGLNYRQFPDSVIFNTQTTHTHITWVSVWVRYARAMMMGQQPQFAYILSSLIVQYYHIIHIISAPREWPSTEARDTLQTTSKYGMMWIIGYNFCNVAIEPVRGKANAGHRWFFHVDAKFSSSTMYTHIKPLQVVKLLSNARILCRFKYDPRPSTNINKYYMTWCNLCVQVYCAVLCHEQNEWS